MYHQTIRALDYAAIDFHERGMMAEKDQAHRLAGRLQHELLSRSPYPRSRRWLDAQWAWAMGHLGLTHQLLRWFKKYEPDTRLVMVTVGSANQYFLQALSQHLVVLRPEEMSDELRIEAMHNAVYFGCPDGVHNLVRFYKMIEQDCADIRLLELLEADAIEAKLVRQNLGIAHDKPFVALHARNTMNDPMRNATAEQLDIALAPYIGKGYAIINTGLEEHPATVQYPSVRSLADPHRASFLLSATCDQFIGSNSGAWVIAHAYQRPVIIINDYAQAAWIYP